MKKNLIELINMVLIFSAIGLILWLVNQNFPASGELQIKSALAKDLPMISKLGPEGRIKIKDNLTLVLDGPVYFDLRFLPWFKKARIFIQYQPKGRNLEGLGRQIGPGFSYEVQKALLISDFEDGFSQAVFDFDLTRVYQRKNITRFLIETKPSSQLAGELRIKELKIILSR